MFIGSPDGTKGELLSQTPKWVFRPSLISVDVIDS